MAYDKLVDSAKLDGALTATADALRAKAGGSAKIAWDATKGFADAITASKSVKSGTFTMAFGTRTVNISGLGFKPSTVIFVLTGNAFNYDISGYCQYAIFNNDSGTTAYFVGAVVEEWTDTDGVNHSAEEAYFRKSTNAGVRIGVNDDGFAVYDNTPCQDDYEESTFWGIIPGVELRYYAF